MNLVLLSEDEIGHDGIVSLSGARAHHIARVLGSGAGDRVRIGVLEGSIGLGTVIGMDGATVRLHCQFDIAPPPRPGVDGEISLGVPLLLQKRVGLLDRIHDAVSSGTDRCRAG